VKVFHENGTFERVIGRRGRGPGEFLRIGALGILGDTLWLSDVESRRLTMMSLEGEVLQMLTFLEGVDGIPAGLVILPPRGFLNTGDGVVYPALPSALGTSDIGRRLPILTMDRSAKTFQILGYVETRHPSIAVEYGTGTMFIVQPFEDRTLVSIAPDGTGILFVDRFAAHAASRDRISLTFVGPTADTLWTDTIGYDPMETPGLLTAAAIDRVERAVTGSAALEARRQLYLPEFLPPVTDAVIAGDGTIWLRREAVSSDSVYWDSFVRGNGFTTRVRTPATFTLRAVHDATLWGDIDEGFPTVVAYTLQRE
jgi:hypothetical protein